MFLLLIVSTFAQRSDVFLQGEAGYECIKIPVLLLTQTGTLIAWAEGRMNSCNDYAWTDLVMKRSIDGGATWSKLVVLVTNSTSDDKNVVGNAAPVQIKTGRILVPFCRNNREIWLTYSDDDGVSWSMRTEIKNVIQSDWQWVGTGPPGSLQLASGRIVVPSYRTIYVYGDGELSHSFMMLSDDNGETWYLGGTFQGVALSNECQGVELHANGTILINARGFGVYRLQSTSFDGGLTFGPAIEVKDLPASLEGCEGSIVRNPVNTWLYFSNPSEYSPVRTNMSLHISYNNGTSWQPYSIIDPGSTAYSSLVVHPSGDVAILYERSNLTKLVFEPQAISYEVVWSPTVSADADVRKPITNVS